MQPTTGVQQGPLLSQGLSMVPVAFDQKHSSPMAVIFTKLDPSSHDCMLDLLHSPRKLAMPGRRLVTTTAFACLIAKFSAFAQSLPSREAVERSIRGNLQNKTLVVGVMELKPFGMYNPERIGNARFTGVSVDQMLHLSKSYGFGVEFRLIDGLNFDEMVATVGGESEYDVAVQLITPTGLRSRAARFTDSPVDSTLVYFMRADRDGLSSPWSVYDAFAPSMWGILLAIMFVFSGVLTLVDFSNESPSSAGTRSSGRHFRRFWDHLYNLGCLLFGHSAGSIPEDTSRRLIIIIFKAFAFGLGALYTALLVNILSPGRNIFDTAALCSGDAPVSINRLAIAEGTSMASYLADYIADAGNNCENQEFMLCKNSDECLEMVERGDADATIYESQIAAFQLSTSKCNKLEVRGDTGSLTGSTWVLPLKSDSELTASGLSSAILLARGDGSFQRIIDGYIKRGTCTPRSRDQVRPLQLIGLFIPLGIMFAVAIAIQGLKHLGVLGKIRRLCSTMRHEGPICPGQVAGGKGEGLPYILTPASYLTR